LSTSTFCCIRNIDSVETRGRGRPKKLNDTPSEEEDKFEATKGRGRQRKDKMEESVSEEKNNDVLLTGDSPSSLATGTGDLLPTVLSLDLLGVDDIS
jgi:hypothetical protein